ncbi:MAG TPA: tetratricopeptide repeat protein [Anaerolineae bacterium]|nr:tetratricopeptide repeat protein [Anaerolineae bacterium]
MNDSPQSRQHADLLFQRAYAQQVAGNLADAILLYRRSIEVYPTAEAHTFLGWTYSFLGRHDDAIEECKKAIEVDPAFGNPYNDIGAYLIELDRPREAIEWLEKATLAPRYEAPHYPWMNLGRAYERIGPWEEAIRCYRKALEIAPDYEVAKRQLNALLARMN